MAKECFNCGEEKMEECQGDFSFEPPPIIKGGTMVIKDAIWNECKHCKYVILPKKLSDQLTELANWRRKNL